MTTLSWYLIGVVSDSEKNKQISENLLNDYLENPQSDIKNIEYLEGVSDSIVPVFYLCDHDEKVEEEIKTIKVDSITYGEVKSTGDYGNNRLIISAQPGEKTPSDTLEILKSYVSSKLKTRADLHELRDEISKKTYELKKVTEALQTARQQWELTADFLEKQGLKTDCPPFPTLNQKTLPEAVDGELEDLPY